MSTLFTFALHVTLVVTGAEHQENMSNLYLAADCDVSQVQMLGETINTQNNVIHYGVDVDERTLEKYSNLV
ncbi:hypothetical protein [Gimesia sp.]|uniref:hypothetical protein n=1 Tax=Gimesia sp. TaxID=2024833 RepID=UPI003A92A1EB